MLETLKQIFSTLDPLNPDVIKASLQIMWQGMLGIFVVMAAITAIIYLFAKFSK